MYVFITQQANSLLIFPAIVGYLRLSDTDYSGFHKLHSLGNTSQMLFCMLGCMYKLNIQLCLSLSVSLITILAVGALEAARSQSGRVIGQACARCARMDGCRGNGARGLVARADDGHEVPAACLTLQAEPQSFFFFTETCLSLSVG